MVEVLGKNSEHNAWVKKQNTNIADNAWTLKIGFRGERGRVDKQVIVYTMCYDKIVGKTQWEDYKSRFIVIFVIIFIDININADSQNDGIEL